MIINGKKLAGEIVDGLKPEFQKAGKAVLAVVVVGGSKIIFSFIAQKQIVAEKLGITTQLFKFSDNAQEKDVIEKIKELGEKKEINGIIVQLPLPEHFNIEEVLNSIPKEKDVDALSDDAKNSLISVEVVKFIFEKYQIVLLEKNIAVVGLGRLIGKPIYNWLSEKVSPSRMSLIKKETSQEERKEIIERADILISGVGKAGLIPTEMIKPGAVLIDFGYDFKDGVISGDIEKESSKKASLFTPTPAGTGPILVAMIFKNLLSLIKNQ